MSKFNTFNAANSIVNVIQTSIGNAAFDTTIRAIIQEKVDEATGKFKLQYQDGVFYAFADDVKINYSKGTEVFVLVPKNDFTQDKRIIGSVKTLGEDYVSVFTQDERYRKIGKSAFEDNSDWFSIKSKAAEAGEQINVLYDETDKDNSLLTLDGNFLNYLKKEQVNGLWLEGTFKTYLNQIQDFNGANYGLRLTFSIGEGNPLTVQLDANSMEGTPFNLSGNRQVIVFSGVDWSTVSSIDKIEFFAEGFSINSVEEDLFVKDIKMYAVSYISDEEQLKSGLTLSSPKGLYIDDGAPIDLTATLRIDGKVQRDKVIYYWFIKDPTITANSNGTVPINPVYNAAGGPGWRCLNSATVKEEKVTTETKGENGEDITSTETIYTINWADGTNTWTFDSEYIPSAQATIMCVAKFENTLYTDTIIIYDKTQTEYFVLTASKEFFTKSEQEITLTLQKQEIKDEQPIGWNTCIWYRQDLYGGAPVKIKETDMTNNTFVVKGSDIVNEATYMVVVQKRTEDDPPIVEHSFTTNPVPLSMRLDEQEEVPPQYTLTIINGDQVFQYSEEGYAPNSSAWVTHSPQDIKALSFVLFDNQLGATVDVDSKQWTIPTEQTLLDGEGGNGDTQAFEIAPIYNASYSNNQITLKVTYNGMTFIATTNFVFVKQGDPGTNGTDVVIVVRKEEESNTVKAHKYVNGIEETFEDELTYYWSGETDIESSLDATATIKSGSEQGVIKCTIKKEGVILYYGYYVLPFVEKENKPEKITFANFSPYIIYDASGNNPKYSRLEVQGLQGTEKVVYQVGGTEYASYSDLIPKQYNSSLASTEGVIKVTAYLKEGMEGEPQEIAKFTLLASLNRHAFSMVNGWDGNLTVDNGNNTILAQTLIAGKKDDANKFTGIMAGTIGQNNVERTGFFGFNQGVQTTFIDAMTGSSIFGSSKGAQFKINIDMSPMAGNNQVDRSSIEFNVPYQGTDNQWSNQSILKISAQDYYLQSANFNKDEATGAKINLKTGEIIAHTGSFADEIELGSGEDVKSIKYVLTKLQSAVEALEKQITELQFSSKGVLSFTLGDGTDKTYPLEELINGIKLSNQATINTYKGDNGLGQTDGVAIYDNAYQSNTESGAARFCLAASNGGAKISDVHNLYSFYVNDSGCHAQVSEKPTTGSGTVTTKNLTLVKVLI